MGRQGLPDLADEHAALHRVATLVAHYVPPAEIFGAVAREVGVLHKVDHAMICRYNDAHNTLRLVTAWSSKGESDPPPSIGSDWSMGPRDGPAAVLRSGRSVRIGYDDATTELAGWARAHQIRWGIAVPIMVEGRLWGVLDTLSRALEPQPEGTEQHMLGFLELVAAAIANTDRCAELAAARARVVAAADAARQRIERDLHDGVQQHLISVGLRLAGAVAAVPPGEEELRQQLSRAVEELTEVGNELREISRGLYPPSLSEKGIESAFKTLARRSAVPVNLHMRISRPLPQDIQVTLYYIVSEALTNTAKHAQASVVDVDIDAQDTFARVSVRDDGVGGAEPGNGTGLGGLDDRVQALGGTFDVVSRPGKGTSLFVQLPIIGEGCL